MRNLGGDKRKLVHDGERKGITNSYDYSGLFSVGINISSLLDCKTLFSKNNVRFQIVFCYHKNKMVVHI